MHGTTLLDPHPVQMDDKRLLQLSGTTNEGSSTTAVMVFFLAIIGIGMVAGCANLCLVYFELKAVEYYTTGEWKW